MPAWLPASPRALLRRSHFERQMEAELAFHMDAYAADLERRGTPRAEAVRHARLVFGRVDDVKERCRQATGLIVWDRGWQDLRNAWRMMRRQASFTLTVVVTLALCIGANTAVFSIVDAVLFRPLPYADPGRLVRIETELRAGTRTRGFANQRGAIWEALRDGVTMLEVAAFVERPNDVNYAGLEGPGLQGPGLPGPGLQGRGLQAPGRPRAEPIQQQRVSAGFFDVLGVAPAIGRGFDRQEDTAGGPAAVVLSHGFWMRAFGGRAEVLDQAILLRGAPHRVVGIMPAGFALGATPDVWTPLRASSTHEGSGDNYSIIARLRPGVTWAQADANVDRAARTLLTVYEPFGVTAHLQLAPLQQSLVGDVRNDLIVLWAAVVLVLLVGCVNIAGLMLARGGSMRREIATRIALGSGRLGVIRQMLVESLALASCGGVAGALVGLLAIAALRPLVAEHLGVWQAIALDLRVLAMTLAATLGTSVLFSLAPVLDACRVDLRSALVGAPGQSGASGRARHATVAHLLPRRVVVVAEIALTVVLLVAAGLLLRTFLHLHRQDAGFDPRGVLTAAVSLEDARYASRERLDRLFETSLTRIRALPGVEHAALGLRLPYELGFNTAVTHIDGRPLAYGGSITNLTYVTPEYFDALRIPRVRGRTFDARDGAGTAPVVVVNQAFVTRHLSGRNPIGARLDLYAVGAAREIVGVVGTIQHAPRWLNGRADRHMPAVYLATTQTSAELFALAHVWFSPSFIVRVSERGSGHASQEETGRAASLGRSAQTRGSSAAGDATGIVAVRAAAGFRRALESVDPLLPVAAVHTADDLKAGAFNVYRFEAAALSGFAALALLLAAVGIYGIVAHGLAERRREFSIRAAIGATRWQAVRAAAAPGITLATVGIVLGCLLGWLACRTLRHLVAGVTPADALMFAIVAGTLFVVAVGASLLPALAAARLDLADTLRAE